MPARSDLAEAVFLARWRALNSESPKFLQIILGQPRCTVRSARVAASFIAWIGSGVGASFIRNAKLAVEDFSYPEPAYLAAWALANRRNRGVSCGVRAVEVILSSESLFSHSSGEQPFVRASRLAISLSDLDVIESVVVWLSTASGDAFVTSCEQEYIANKALACSRLLVSEALSTT